MLQKDSETRMTRRTRVAKVSKNRDVGERAFVDASGYCPSVVFMDRDAAATQRFVAFTSLTRKRPKNVTFVPSETRERPSTSCMSCFMTDMIARLHDVTGTLFMSYVSTTALKDQRPE